jgi:GlpG protein
MRQAGTLSSKSEAERFASYLLTLGISSKVDPAGDAWALWVHDENQLDESKRQLDEFRARPDDDRYRSAERAAVAVRREAAEKQRRAQKRYIDMRNEWANPWRRRPVTIGLIAISVLVYLSESPEVMGWLAFSMPEIDAGQLWRLVTPIFMHFSIAHILFNMWWLYDLGTLIERQMGSRWFALLVLAVALPSNFAQYEVTGPAFGGMSGVVYGLFGYAWIRGRLDPTCGLYLRPDVAFWMLAWFGLCALGGTINVGNVANWAHGGGLVAGVAIGYLAHRRKLLL